MTTEELVDLDAPIDYADLEAKYSVKLDTSFSNIIIVDHLPQVDSSKEEKLLAVLQKNVFGKENKPILNGIFMPRDDDNANGLSRGYLFVEFETTEMAEAALKNANGFKLDKTHVLSAIRFSEFNEILKTPEVFETPVVDPFEEREYLKSWLSDEQARDQYLINHAGNVLNVYWSNKRGSPEQIQGRGGWCDSGAVWSTRGSFLVTLHNQGVQLWGGENFKRITRFPHPMVKNVLFSPTEKYLATISDLSPGNEEEHNVQVWDVATSKLIRGFTAKEAPFVKFSFDDCYFARIYDCDNLAIHELPSGQLHDKKPLNAPSIQDFEWSPKDLSLIYWAKGTENTPSRVALIQVPSRLVLRSKNLFNVEGCQLVWQSDGDFISVLVNRFSKSKTNVFTSLEIFRVRQKNIPVDVVDFGAEQTELLRGVYWQPGGDKFVTHHNIEFKSLLTLYTVNHIENGLEIVKELARVERKQISSVFWSPRGDFLVMGGFESSTAALEFWQCSSTGELVLVGTREHVFATEVAWEPAGRFVVSWVNSKRFSSNNDVQIWDVKGDLISRLSLPRITNFMWRPRPQSLLSKDTLKTIKKNLKSISQEYEAQDAKADASLSQTKGDLRKRLWDEWNAFRASANETFVARTALRDSILNKKSNEEQTEQVQIDEWIEEVLEENEEIIGEAVQEEIAD
jgi:translation initiation factor 3 subunit B